MKWEGRRQSDNVHVGPPDHSKKTRRVGDDDPIDRGISMGVGDQLQVIEKMGMPTKDGVKKDRIKK